VLPACDAVIVQVPAPRIVTIALPLDPCAEHAPPPASVTAFPEAPPVADTANG
jgi:hypothetical protein